MSKTLILPEITNWKLREVINDVTIVDTNSSIFKHNILEKLQLPIGQGFKCGPSVTDINWENMSNHYSFYFDKIGWENKIKNAFEQSLLIRAQNLIITYGFSEPTILIPVKVFLDDWDGFFASVRYAALIFSEDYKLIMEVSRDYYLHSNFYIQGEE